VNKYLAEREARGERPAPLLLRKATRYVSRILSVFGLEQGADRMAFVGDAAAGGDRSAPVLNAFAAFRDQLREFARSDAGKPARAEVRHGGLRVGDKGSTAGP